MSHITIYDNASFEMIDTPAKLRELVGPDLLAPCENGILEHSYLPHSQIEVARLLTQAGIDYSQSDEQSFHINF